MVTENQCIQKDLLDDRNTRHMTICLKDSPSAFPIYVLKNGPTRQESGCLSNWSQTFTYTFPSFGMIGFAIML